MPLNWESLLETYANRVHFQDEDLRYMKHLVRVALLDQREMFAQYFDDCNEPESGEIIRKLGKA